MSLSKSNKFPCKGTVRQVLICIGPRTPYPSPIDTVYVYIVYHPTLVHCISVYCILIHTWKGGRGEQEGRGHGGRWSSGAPRVPGLCSLLSTCLGFWSVTRRISGYEKAVYTPESWKTKSFFYVFKKCVKRSLLSEGGCHPTKALSRIVLKEGRRALKQ
jgi:hypothetical protein